MGLLSNYRTNYLSIGWQLAPFRSIPGHGLGSADQFHTLEFSLRYHLSDRFKLLAYQPYRINRRMNNDQRVQQLKGISDTRIVAAYTLIKDASLGAVNVFWETGAGVKLPVGAYNARIHDADLPENFNIGNGSWAYLFQNNLVLTYRQLGLVVNGAYQHQRPSRSDYQFGHQWTGQLLLFAEARLGNQMQVVPNAGLTLEKITSDYHPNGQSVAGTGGRGIFVSSGINFKAGSWIIGAAAALPVNQSYSKDEVEARPRLTSQILFTF
ncbi:hypothetical protein CRP01_30465 [Flavilitoribacter nigricans DSM 23189 = NBRC 102662]|uniref:Transporter n=2 Tax=Flavilitoribacter TaxID=2762562 RepID=A0A2D0N3I5_FLAN2|nr:hypothetical protein CRP01_30465 [Flavilitoribacter nigricans DSM 23189 = NBRC 102662]